MYLDPEEGRALLHELFKWWMMIKLSPLLIWKFVEIMKTATVSDHLCPRHVWQIDMLRIPPLLAHQIMTTMHRMGLP